MKLLRSFVFATAVAAFSCGGSAPSPEAPAPSATPSAAPAPSAAADMPSPAPEAAPSAAPAAAAAPAAPARTPATLDGSILGKPFHGDAACVAAVGRKVPGTMYVEVYSAKDFDVSKMCGRLTPDKDARKLGMLIAWKDGAQTDAAKLKGGADPELLVMAGTGNPKKFDLKATGKDFKAKGTITVLRAGMKKGDVARIKLDLDMGKDKLQGEIDVDVLADLQ
jgi:hypothetical protein